MRTLITIVMALTLTGCMVYGQANEAPPPPPGEEQPEVLTRGPVHEAFAEPVTLQDESPVIAPTAPPEPIDEVAPADRPVGDQFVWVPGYWAWDSDRNGYIWISGCWRAAPPGLYWVPGYWSSVGGHWEWVAGFWAPVSNTEIEYLPPPPALVNVEAPGAPPYPDRVWVPPCWYWREGRYVLRNGYWIAAQSDWVWTPSHYIYTPRGHVFVRGHWDYSFGRRGVLFAPVYFPRHFYGRPHFSYSLGVVVDTGALEFSLFTCPRYSHYYFGDYYDDTYVSIGIFPWFECERRHTWYDPIYVHDRWRHREEHRDWDDYERREYDRRRADRDLRPPRTYREQEARIAKMPESRRKEFQVAESMTTVVNRKTTMKFEKIKTSERQKIVKQSADIRNFGTERSKWEAKPRGTTSEQKVPFIPEGQRRGEQKTEEKTPKIETGGPRGSEKAPKMEEGRPGTAEGIRRGEPAKGEERKVEKAPQGQEGKAPEIQQGKEGRQESEKVKVPTPPIVGRQGGIFRKGPPSRPSDEQNTEVKEAPKGKEPQKSEERRVERESRKGDGAQKKDK